MGDAPHIQMVVVDCLHKRLDLAPLTLAGFRHPPCDLGRVALDTGNDGVSVGVRLGAIIHRLDDNYLQTGGSGRLSVFLLKRSNKPPEPSDGSL